MSTNPLVHSVWTGEPMPAQQVKLAEEWQGITCSIGHTQHGRMFCAMCCEGDRCDQPASETMLAEFRQYDAKRRRNNRKAESEERYARDVNDWGNRRIG